MEADLELVRSFEKKEVDPYPRYKIMIHTVLFGSSPFQISFIHHAKSSERVLTGGASNGFNLMDTFECTAGQTKIEIRALMERASSLFLSAHCSSTSLFLSLLSLLVKTREASRLVVGTRRCECRV